MAPPPTPASRDFTATTGWSAGGRRIGTQCLRLLPRHAPSRGRGDRPRPIYADQRYRRPPSHVPSRSGSPGSRRLYAGHHLASTRAPARLCPERFRLPLGFDATCLTYDASTATASGPPSAALVRLPGPHLARLARLFPDAHHDGLQPTQLRVVWRLLPKADAGGPSVLHLLLSTVSEMTPTCSPPLRS